MHTILLPIDENEVRAERAAETVIGLPRENGGKGFTPPHLIPLETTALE